jgi:DNA-binding transcriptional regulator YiaG
MTLIALPSVDISTGGFAVAGSAATLRAAVVTIGLLWAPHSAAGYPGTSSNYLIERPLARTTATPDTSLATIPSESVGQAILEIRRRSGLTWDEIAGLFEVSRRSVHHWASGKTVSAEHDQRIRRTLAIIRRIDRGDAQSTRNLLLTPDADGQLGIDLLRQGASDEILAQAGTAIIPPQLAPTPLSDKARRDRRPVDPASLLLALNDRPAGASNPRVARTYRGSKPAD